MTRESGNRAAFLETMRPAVSVGPEQHLRPVTPLGANVPPVAYDGTAEFTAALTALGGHARFLTDAASLLRFLDDALPGEKSLVRVAMTDEPECAAVAYALGGRDNIEVVNYADAAAVATADVGITGARAAVSRTGSIVVDAARAGGRTVSLLPPVHVALVRADALVMNPGDLWRSLTHPMPSNLVQITGPSRSADIELVITLGVHGPRELWVGLLEIEAQENSA